MKQSDDDATVGAHLDLLLKSDAEGMRGPGTEQASLIRTIRTEVLGHMIQCMNQYMILLWYSLMRLSYD